MELHPLLVVSGPNGMLDALCCFGKRAPAKKIRFAREGSVCGVGVGWRSARSVLACSAGIFSREGLLVIPRKPPGRMFPRFLGMALKGVEIVQGVAGAEPAGVDQAHEQVPQPSAVLGFVAQRVFAVIGSFR